MMEKGRILIVEDDPLVAEDISLRLQQFGYEVVAIAADGPAALAWVRDAAPDLVLMDIVLPGPVDGIDTAAQIIAQQVIPVIYLTAYVDDELVKRAKITEPYGYILKPYTGRELNAAVSIALYKSRVARELKKAAQVAATLTNISDPLLVVDRQGAVCQINTAMLGLLGVDATDVIGQPAQGLIRIQRQGAGPNLTSKLLKQVLASHHPLVDDEYLYLHSTDRSIPVSVRFSEIPQTPEWAGGVVLLMQDITERRELEQELELAAQVFAHSAQGILITDPQARIIRANDAFLRITGYSREEVLGRNPRLLKSGYHDQEFYQAMWRELLDTGSWQGEVWNRRSNSEIYPELLNIAGVLDTKGDTRYYIGVFADISATRSMQERLHYMAHYDSLTGLANRVLFEERVNLTLADARRLNNRAFLLMLDIDNFKAINETSGHAFGDQLLCLYAQRLREIIDKDENIARIGGDVFAIILEDEEGPGFVVTLAQKLLDTLGKPLSDKGKRKVSLAASIGISTYPDDGTSIQELLQNADTALHSAKAQGRNKYRLFDRLMYDRAVVSLSMEQSLRRALERQELTLHYQPQVDLLSGKVVGCEVLLRWDSKDLGKVSPAQFIPVAESIGMIIEIGAWVLEQACLQYRQWERQGIAPPRVAVNVSVYQIRDPFFGDTVAQILEHTGMAPANLELEITESVAMEEGVPMLQRLQKLKELGITLSLDDFGTGYSALSSLQRFPFDTLKIDRSFIVESIASEGGSVMLESIISMAKGLNLASIAEGVESNEQLQFLRRLGCQQVQGFYFSHPVPAAQFARLMKQSFKIPPAGKKP